MTDLTEYQKFTRTTAIYPQHKSIDYLSLGLVSEAGEVAGVVKKWIRGDIDTATMHKRIGSELVDVLWYWVRLFDDLGLDIEQEIAKNKEKLMSRLSENNIRGDGDDR